MKHLTNLYFIKIMLTYLYPKQCDAQYLKYIEAFNLSIIIENINDIEYHIYYNNIDTLLSKSGKKILIPSRLDNYDILKKLLNLKNIDPNNVFLGKQIYATSEIHSDIIIKLISHANLNKNYLIQILNDIMNNLKINYSKLNEELIYKIISLNLSSKNKIHKYIFLNSCYYGFSCFISKLGFNELPYKSFDPCFNNNICLHMAASNGHKEIVKIILKCIFEYSNKSINLVATRSAYYSHGPQIIKDDCDKLHISSFDASGKKIIRQYYFSSNELDNISIIESAIENGHNKIANILYKFLIRHQLNIIVPSGK